MAFNHSVSFFRCFQHGLSLPYVLSGTLQQAKACRWTIPFLDYADRSLSRVQVQYSRLLEEGDFRGRTANYIWMLLFGVVSISVLASFSTNLHFLGHALSFQLTYCWGRRNEDVKMAFLGILQFNAPYLPWVMLTFSALLGHSIVMDLIGIGVGHVYYYLEWVYPTMAEIRGWKIRRLTDPPVILQWLCGDVDSLHFQPPPVPAADEPHLHQD
jgi:Derlin-2/3